MTYTLASPLTPFVLPAAGWEALLTAHEAYGGADAIVTVYAWWCHTYGIDTNLALAQFCHETGYGTSERWREEWNPAGLGITSDSTPPNPFATFDEGIRAHIEHLCAYVYTAAACPCDHGHLADRRHFFHKGAPTLSGLEDVPPKWAVPGTGYLASIVAIANAVGGTPMATAPTAADLGYPGTVEYATGSGETMAIADVRWFVLHDTEGGFAGSKATLSGQISAHLLIDKDGTWCFMVPLTGVAYATGNLPVNRQSINVEHVGFADAHDGGYTDAQYRCCAAFYRWCVRQGMVNVPAVYIGKRDTDGGPEPDDPGILGHMDVPRDDGGPGWGGNYGHTDPGRTYDVARLIGYIGDAPPPDNKVNGHVLAGGFRALWDGTPDRMRIFGFPVSEEYNGTLGGLPVTVQDFERAQMVYDVSTPDPWRVRVPLRGEKVRKV